MDIDDIRLTNIDHAIKSHCGGVRSELARRLGREPTSIARWWLKSKHRRKVGYDSAREIEKALGIPSGWIDQSHDNLNDLEVNPKRRAALRIASGETYPIPLHYSATIDQRLRMTFITEVKGTLMLLSTDPAAYAIQLIGHNPTIWLHEHWMIVVEPNTPVSANECALLYLKTGEQLLRLMVHVGEHLVMVRNPVTGEQEPYEIGQIEKMEYAYIGIPPSKVVPLTNNI